MQVVSSGNIFQTLIDQLMMYFTLTAKKGNMCLCVINQATRGLTAFGSIKVLSSNSIMEDLRLTRRHSHIDLISKMRPPGLNTR